VDTGFVLQYATVGRLSAANGRFEAAAGVLEETASRDLGERARMVRVFDFPEIAHDPGCRQLIRMVCPAP